MKESTRKRTTAVWRPWGDHPWLVAISTVAAVATVVSVLISLWENSKPKSQHDPYTPVVSEPAASSPVEPVLPEEPARAQIGTLLREGQIDKAIEIIQGFSLGPVRSEECDRVFSFCLKNQRLDKSRDKAKRVATLCWDGERRQKAMEEIALALLRER
jgi:hypothetical protein